MIDNINLLVKSQKSFQNLKIYYLIGIIKEKLIRHKTKNIKFLEN
jgi:hypothetical protein